MPRPVSFICRARFDRSSSEIAESILDLDQWEAFPGWGPLPGIRSAEFQLQTTDIVGTRISVTNRDGSQHIEEITEWNLPHALALKLCEFSPPPLPPPLFRFAIEFTERWEFATDATATLVTRTFVLTPASPLKRSIIMLIAIMLKRAVMRHMRMLGATPRPKSQRDRRF